MDTKETHTTILPPPGRHQPPFLPGIHLPLSSSSSLSTPPPPPYPAGPGPLAPLRPPSCLPPLVYHSKNLQRFYVIALLSHIVLHAVHTVFSYVLLSFVSGRDRRRPTVAPPQAKEEGFLPQCFRSFLHRKKPPYSTAHHIIILENGT